MSKTNQICPICAGKRTRGKTTFSADLGSGVVDVRKSANENKISDGYRGRALVEVEAF